MKTFRELISWELEQESKQKPVVLSLTEDDGNTKLSASLLRKIKHLNSTASAQKTQASQLSAA